MMHHDSQGSASLVPFAAFSTCFGYTHIEGMLPKKVPICGVLGDSRAALFGQGCPESEPPTWLV